MNVSSKVIAGCFALSAFIVAILAGVAVDNPAGQIITRAPLAMAVCYPIGMIAGSICTHVIALHVEQYSVRSTAAHEEAAALQPKQNQEEEEAIVV